MTIDRRSLLQALAGLAGAALARPAPGQPVSVAQFGALSAALTGYPPADADTVARVMRAFATSQRRGALVTLAKLAAQTPPDQLDAAIAAAQLDGAANDLVAAWYSGVVGEQVVLYTQAQVWTAMSYTKPMGVCGGVTGYWADPPA